MVGNVHLSLKLKVNADNYADNASIYFVKEGRNKLSESIIRKINSEWEKTQGHRQKGEVLDLGINVEAKQPCTGRIVFEVKNEEGKPSYCSCPFEIIVPKIQAPV